MLLRRFAPFQSTGSHRVRGAGRQDRYNVTTLRPAALSIRAYDEWDFNASRKRGAGGPNDLAGRRYGSRTLLNIGQFPPPSLFTCENLCFLRSNISAPLSVLATALPSSRNVKEFGRSVQSIIRCYTHYCPDLFEYRPSSVKNERRQETDLFPNNHPNSMSSLSLSTLTGR
ncbi:hypothetical protein ARMSODRAFT_298771 [Armillaria solidipes]|uniref:Uncharacterized protein n=1 Tax=Armillaria solidipes TaxID=1076256 RepID=A0A2H3BA29_9AGAR|nr:hypothetical protein ARMSODRAFT_298771 [Armillaria solidipes]